MSEKIIYLGTDHGGFELKEKIKVWLGELGYIVEDLGAESLVSEDDYPEYAFSVANKVSLDILADKDSIGILLCRSGGGMVIAANKVKGIRAVSIFNEESAALAREKNNANIVSISADWTTEDQVKKMVLEFLETSFSGAERHVRRINKIKEFENAPLGDGGRKL